MVVGKNTLKYYAVFYQSFFYIRPWSFDVCLCLLKDFDNYVGIYIFPLSTPAFAEDIYLINT